VEVWKCRGRAAILPSDWQEGRRKAWRALPFLLPAFPLSILPDTRCAQVLFIILFGLSGCEKLTDTVVPHANISDMEPLTVMTYNVYVGANRRPVLLPTDPQKVLKEALNLTDRAYTREALPVAQTV